MNIQKDQQNDVQRTWGYTHFKVGWRRRAGEWRHCRVRGTRYCWNQGLFTQGLEAGSLYFEQYS